MNIILLNSKITDLFNKGETKRRSLLKAISWRTIGTLDTIVISYFLTGQIKIAISIGGIEIFTKMILYFFHERAWNMIKWGKRKLN